MCNKLLSYVLSSYPLLWVKTHEEGRVINEYTSQLLGISVENETYDVYVWDVADGLHQLKRDKEGGIVSQTMIENTDADPLAPITWLAEAKENIVLILKDYHTFFAKDCKDGPLYVRKIRNLLETFKAKNQMILIISPILNIPIELDKEITVIDYKLPGRDELKQVMKAVHASTIDSGKRNAYPKTEEPVIIDACLGMTANEAENALSRSMVDKKCFDAKLIRAEKASVVKKTGKIEIIDSNLTINDMGGLENLKEWLVARKECFTEKAKAFGIVPPKGILLVGPPGCGKSMTAKIAASILERPLLRLDMGNIFGSYVGESEGNMRAVLDMCTSIAPIVLWLDEIEKSMAGNKGGEGHESTRRVFQLLLTWMQERTSDVFLVATANNIQSLPPELIRPGRIDVTFWVDLPDYIQREEIFKIHLAKKGRSPDLFDSPASNMDSFIKATENYSGAEIEVIVGESLVRAYGLGHPEVTIEDILETCKDITPISRLMSADIEAARKWKDGRGIKNASKVHANVIPVSEVPKRKIKA